VTSRFDLNPEQQQAVDHDGGPLLVVAGAGSGKTRVLTARVARLVETGVAPQAILAFTFTNRAAREMRARIEGALSEPPGRLWVGTFHATAVRILRREAREIGLAPGFAIYDREDQESILKRVMAPLGLPEQVKLGQVLSRISDAKNALVSPAEVARTAVTPYQRQIAECYRLYQEALRAAAALDFDDLIAEVVRQFIERPELAERYSRRFEHVLVDEYQDTNHAQFRLLQLLTATHRNPFAVGDDDQSIYGWRGADLANVLEFEQRFPGARIIRLEQNYRSTGTILDAANAVIANNRARKGKNLWSDRGAGVPLRFVLAGDEVEEARRIRAFIEGRVQRGGRRSECAVLYRTNAQSRALETELRRERIPYEIVGGVSFYQRREVKDLLAYLRVAVNPLDVASFWRIWNTPRRGLGGGARDMVEQRIAATGEGPVAGLRGLLAAGVLNRPAAAGARDLLLLFAELTERIDDPADALLLHVLERTKYLEFLDAAPGENAEDRRANIEELVAAGSQFAGDVGGTLADFLAESALTTDADRVDAEADRVLMLTAHNAKGLEFPAVVIAGLEEGLFPHGNSMEDEERLEEERRLFYVALTRAQDEVLLTAAAFRRRFDGARGGRVSRFVDEIPAKLLTRDESARQHVRGAANSGRGWSTGERREPEDGGRGARRAEETPMAWPAPPTKKHRAVGREVFHEQFGRGVVVAAEGDGPDARFTVRFAGSVRKIMGRFLSEESHVD
jgi:DNA helicase-2/ATP-dependent DNA helicase PcrA